MSNFNDKTNNEIILELKQMQLDHEAVKAKILKDYDILEAIERRFSEAHVVLNDRINSSHK